MRFAIRSMMGVLALSCLTAVPAAEPIQPLARKAKAKVVTIDCSPGWRGSAGGSYGGVSFVVSCDNGRGKVRLDGTAGTSYAVRMGVESDSLAIDCFFTGDRNNVNETCGPVRLTIR